MTLGIIVRDGSTPRTISEIVVRDASNTQRTISEIWIRDTNNTPRLVFNPSGSASLAVEVVPAGASGFSFGTGTATTGSVTATATGGAAPYTYEWFLDSYSSLYAAPTADSPSSATTTFTQTSIDPNTIETSSWSVRATDDDGNTADSDLIPANFTDISGP